MEWKNSQRCMDERIPIQFRQTISDLIDSLIKPERLSQDLLFALLLLLMKENSFLQLKSINGGTISVIDYILSRKDKGSAIYEAVFILNGFTETPLKIIAAPISNNVLINAIIPDIQNRSFSVCLPIDRYVATSQLGLPSCFPNYSDLIHVFKDKIVTPLKCAILHHHGYPSSNLAGLPEHIIQQIFLNLPLRSILNATESCKRIHSIVNDDRFWHRLCARDFSDFSERKCEEKDWRDVYKEMYVTTREESKRVDWTIRNSSSELRELSEYSDSHGTRWQMIL